MKRTLYQHSTLRIVLSSTAPKSWLTSCVLRRCLAGFHVVWEAVLVGRSRVDRCGLEGETVRSMLRMTAIASSRRGTKMAQTTARIIALDSAAPKNRGSPTTLKESKQAAGLRKGSIAERSGSITVTGGIRDTAIPTRIIDRAVAQTKEENTIIGIEVIPVVTTSLFVEKKNAQTGDRTPDLRVISTTL